MGYLKNSIKTYVQSFNNRKILIVAILNIFLVIATAALIKLTSLISQPWLEKINKVGLSSIAAQTEAQLQAIISTLKGFALFTILTAIILILLLIINWSFFQGFIYHILLEKKFSLKYFEKFLLLNLVWSVPWITLFSIILFGAKTEYLAASFYSLILFFLHSSFVLYTLFVNNRLKTLIHLKTHFKISIAKIYHFIIPYTLITITFLIISQLNLLKLNILVISLIYTLFFSWLQNYTKDIIIGIKV